MQALRNQWILVTGASSGLCKKMALQLARDYGANVILLARRRENLEALAAEIIAQGGSARIISADLSQKKDLERIVDELSRLNIKLSGVILNAGITHFGLHSELTPDSTQNLIDTNLSSLVYLTNHVTGYFRKHDIEGRIMLLSSLAGSIALPYQSLYSGTKAFVTSFGLSLGHEVRGDGISVTVFAPGGIATEMATSSGLSTYFAKTNSLMNVERCAQIALKAFEVRKTFVVPGLINRIGLLLARLGGARMSTALMGWVFHRALRVARA